MELSIREARAQFAKAIEAAQRGERVVITKNGAPVAELGPARKRGLDWEALHRFRKERGLDKLALDYPLDEKWREEFDDPAFGRELFGPDYFDEEPDR